MTKVQRDGQSSTLSTETCPILSVMELRSNDKIRDFEVQKTQMQGSLWSLNSSATSDTALDLSGPFPPLSQEDCSGDQLG